MSIQEKDYVKRTRVNANENGYCISVRVLGKAVKVYIEGEKVDDPNIKEVIDGYREALYNLSNHFWFLMTRRLGFEFKEDTLEATPLHCKILEGNLILNYAHDSAKLSVSADKFKGGTFTDLVLEKHNIHIPVAAKKLARHIFSEQANKVLAEMGNSEAIYTLNKCNSKNVFIFEDDDLEKLKTSFVDEYEQLEQSISKRY